MQVHIVYDIPETEAEQFQQALNDGDMLWMAEIAEPHKVVGGGYS